MLQSNVSSVMGWCLADSRVAVVLSGIFAAGGHCRLHYVALTHAFDSSSQFLGMGDRTCV